mgnify:CR=1 FL=1
MSNFKPGDIIINRKIHNSRTLIIEINGEYTTYCYVAYPNKTYEFDTSHFDQYYVLDREYIFNMEMQSIIDD